MGKNDFENRLLAGDMAMLWQGRMNQGPKFLLVTVVDAQKKFHDPESIFWVSNNTFLETVTPKIAKFDDFWPFFKLKPIEKLKYGPNILHGHIVDLNKDS